MQINLNVAKEKSEDKKGHGLKINKPIMIISFMIVLSIVLFLTIGVDINNLDYVMSQRIPKLLAIIVTGAAIGFSTIVFQTITNNRIITPNVLGLDSLYVLVQSLIVFLFGTSSFFITNKLVNFFISVAVMVLAALLLHKVLFKEKSTNIVYLVLVGMVFGTLFSSLSSFMQMIIDPNEFLVLQNKLFASFNNIHSEILFIALTLIAIVFPFIYDDLKYLDVIALGRDYAIGLGIDYNKIVKKFMIVIAIFISVSTALVGPITFLGVLVVNIAREVIKSYKHSLVITMSILVSVFTLVSGQLLVERILHLNTPVSVIINLVGGIYFIYLLMKGKH